MNLTRRQTEIYDYLVDNAAHFDHPPTHDELCVALGLSSRGSLHKHIKALIEAGLVEPMVYAPDAVQVQGVLRGLLRSYR